MRKALKAPARRYSRAFASDLSGGMNSFTDSRVLGFSRGEIAYNVCTDSGALENGYGATESEFPSKYDRVFYYKLYDDDTQTEKGYYIAHESESGKIFGGDGSEWQEIEGAVFVKPPLGVNYRLYGDDVFLLCGEEGMAVVDSLLRAVTVPTAPSITGIAMHNERMFVTIGGRKNAIWFSDDLDPTNWNPELDEGGFIELEGERGRLNKAVAFGGYVYIFRDYGISRLTAYGDQSEFSVTNLFVSSGKIYSDTVAVCGDRILFAADDGLYSFDGITTSRIARHLDGLIEYSRVRCGAYSAGKYYLAAAGGFLVAVDPRTLSTSVSFGADIISFSQITDGAGERLLCLSPDKSFLGEIKKCPDFFGEPLTKVWKSGLSDFGSPESRKLITDVYLDTKYDVTVTVRTEKGEKTFVLKGKNAVQRKRVNLIGTKVQLEISASGNISAARPAIRFTNIA